LPVDTPFSLVGLRAVCVFSFRLVDEERETFMSLGNASLIGEVFAPSVSSLLDKPNHLSLKDLPLPKLTTLKQVFECGMLAELAGNEYTLKHKQAVYKAAVRLGVSQAQAANHDADKSNPAMKKAYYAYFYNLNKLREARHFKNSKDIKYYTDQKALWSSSY
jgi:hypothetical protein